MRRAARKDSNHHAIARELAQVPGVHVLDVAALPNGFDLAVFYQGRGVAVEVKAPGQRPRPDQAVRLAEWGDCAIVARCAEDVLAALGIMVQEVA